MFSFLRKWRGPQIHDPIEIQEADLRKEGLYGSAIRGKSCDELRGASGPFGHSYDNPIPVNGDIGALKYLGKLLTPRGTRLVFHRFGSLKRSVARFWVDVYECFDTSGEHRDFLFVDTSHPRRSNKAPAGYTFLPYDAQRCDSRNVFGVDVFCEGFPSQLPEVLNRLYGMPDLAAEAREVIDKMQVSPRPDHLQKYLELHRMLASRTYEGDASCSRQIVVVVPGAPSRL